MKRNHKWFFWVIVALAFVATSLSFLDRQVLSILIIEIKEDLSISDVDYGFINTGFLIGYAIMFTVGGFLIDKFGSRLGLAVSVGLWSVATALHGVANNVMQFGIFRFVLGVGEGGAFPGAIKSVIEWVPKKKHALANGIAIGGSALGAVIAPPLCIYFFNITGWRGVFLITAGIGFVWVLLWLLASGKKKLDLQNNIATDIVAADIVDAEIIAADINKAVTPKTKNKVSILSLLKIKEVWVFILMRFLLDPIFYYYMFWIPKFMNETRDVSLEQIGQLLWIPFLALGISNILGGWLSDMVYTKTSNLNFGRKIIMFIAALMMLPMLFIKFLPSPEMIILFLCIALFSHGLWITNYITAIGDTFGSSGTSTVIGLSGTAGAISALVLNPIIGLVVTKISYDPMWIYCGIMYLVAFIAFVVLIPKIKLLKVHS